MNFISQFHQTVILLSKTGYKRALNNDLIIIKFYKDYHFAFSVFIL